MTIRQRAQAIVSRHGCYNPAAEPLDQLCDACDDWHPCENRKDAQAILDALDAAARDDELGGTGARAMVYDHDDTPDRDYPRWTGAEPQEMP